MSMQMVEIPSNVDIVGWKNKSTPIVKKKKRTVKKYKTPLAVRKKMAAARKKIKIPIVAGAAIGTPIAYAGVQAVRHSGGMWDKTGMFFRKILSYYTGITISDDLRRTEFKLEELMKGGIPLAAIALDAKLIGMRRYANKLLANANIPVLRL